MWNANCIDTASMTRRNSICTLNLEGRDAQRVTLNCPTRQRLAQAFSCLQRIQMVRNHRQDPRLGRPEEDRIIWRELLELELQEVDERIAQITAAADSVRASSERTRL